MFLTAPNNASLQEAQEEVDVFAREGDSPGCGDAIARKFTVDFEGIAFAPGER